MSNLAISMNNLGGLVSTRPPTTQPPTNRPSIWSDLINQGFQYGRDWLETYREQRGLGPIDPRAEEARVRALLQQQQAAAATPNNNNEANKNGAGGANVKFGFNPDGSFNLGTDLSLSPLTLGLIGVGVYLLFREPPKRGRS